MRLQCNNVRRPAWMNSAHERFECFYIFDPDTMYGLDVDASFENTTGTLSLVATPDGLLRPADRKHHAVVTLAFTGAPAALITGHGKPVMIEVLRTKASTGLVRMQFQQELSSLLHAYYDSCAYLGCELSHFIFSFYGP